MAESPAHRFGQIIGEVLEASISPLLAEFADKHGLYFDKQGERPCRPGRKKCTWLDLNNNKHDLDFVLERGGTANKLGVPAAFIETAWRGYTKHSRNKAQEIQGAVLPLAQTFRNAHPFVGVVLAGRFTEGSLKQLRSLGFCVLHFSYESVVNVFKKYGIDASSEEKTPVGDFKKKIRAYENLSAANRVALSRDLLKSQRVEVQTFMASLEKVVLRQVESITVLPLHGASTVLTTAEDAIKFIRDYAEKESIHKFDRYEIRIRYNNGDSIEASFRDKGDAISFLEVYLPVPGTAAARR